MPPAVREQPRRVPEGHVPARHGGLLEAGAVPEVLLDAEVIGRVLCRVTPTPGPGPPLTSTGPESLIGVGGLQNS